MASPQSKLSRPLGISPIKTGKQVTIEDDPEDQILMGRRPHESPGSRVKMSGGNQDGSRLGEGHRIYQPKEEMDHVYSREQGYQAQKTAQHQKHEHKLEQSRQKSGQPETHEQFPAPGVGATPQAPGVYLHTSANPTMSVGYTQGYSVLRTQPSAPVNNIVHQPFLQDLNPGVNPFNTTYIGARSMTYYRNTHNQQGSRYDPLALHFQPPVPDTTYGPMTHVYVPGQDPPGLHAPADGPVQAPLQPQAGISTGHSLTVHHQLTIPAVHLQYPGQHMQYPGQPAMFSGQVMPGAYPSQPAQTPIMCAPSPVAAVPGVPGLPMASFPLDAMGASKTMADIQAHHHEITMANPNLEPEDFQPASTDPSKMYYCRELDGNWTLRTRYSIDKMGDWRWYQTPDGAFYAVRLPN